ncbi:MAG: hypothetical protein LBB43_00680 [Spirochaetaceae bacterium]|jgi:hypothetical protein|nr:hypothetical protein [Spirochaetaceae bacterium]
MKKKLFLAEMLAMALAVGMMIVGCDDDTTEEDTWSNVTSLSQMDGTWKGSYSQTMTMQEATEQAGESWSSEMQTMFGDMKVTVSMEMTIIINAGAKTQATDTKTTMAYSGGNINALWPVISAGYSSQSDVTVDNSKYSITMTQNSPPTAMKEEDITEMLELGLQINQSRTKIKIPADSMGLDSEIIGVKQ